ncbi:MAG: hypothetical protein U5Q44_13850 [Dehalococcoidia bacterium]|nr:hypothetical protein [Dehalococcoidia bacterium]
MSDDACGAEFAPQHAGAMPRDGPGAFLAFEPLALFVLFAAAAPCLAVGRQVIVVPVAGRTPR